MLLSFHIVFIDYYFNSMNYFTHNYFLFLFGAIILFFTGACNNSYVDEVDRGGGYKYRPGYPELRVVASSYIDEDDKGYINVASEIVYGSLVYRKEDSLFVADATIDYQIIDVDNPLNILGNKQFPITVSDRTNRLTYDQSTYKIENDFQLKPGNYEVITTLIDNTTGRQTTRTSEVFIPDLKNEENNITNIRIFTKSTKENAEYIPVTTYDVQSDIDSLKFIFQITNSNISDPLTINTKLFRFESDTTIARPMNYSNYSTSSIQNKGIDYSERTEINSNRRTLTTPGNVLIEFKFPKLERGNYRFEVTSNLNEENELFKAREFSIKSPNYPSLSDARELAKPLYYLMREKKYKELMAIEDPVEMKKAIDRFWLSNIKNSRIAKSVVELFYERVEEANKQFSNFKEGWKTDQGMIYILFGPPWYIDSSLNNTAWRYSYNSSDPEKNFFFRSPKLKNKFFPFDNYLLQRSTAYHNVQYKQIELWLTGLILTADL